MSLSISSLKAHGENQVAKIKLNRARLRAQGLRFFFVVVILRATHIPRNKNT